MTNANAKTARKIAAPTGTPAKTTSSKNGANATPKAKSNPTPKKETTVKTTTKPATPAPLCACGCDAPTKGGTYRPGHDAKAKSAALQVLRNPASKPAARKEAEAFLTAMNHTPADRTPTPCECGCKELAARTYLPGHDAKHKSNLIAAALTDTKAGENAKAILEAKGWTKFLTAKVERLAAKEAAKAAKAAEKAAAAK